MERAIEFTESPEIRQIPVGCYVRINGIPLQTIAPIQLVTDAKNWKLIIENTGGLVDFPVFSP